MQCPACEREVPLGESLCPACLTPVDAPRAETARDPTPAAAPDTRTDASPGAQADGAGPSPDSTPDAAGQAECPTHAGMPVAGTCARCGRFVCIRCTREVLTSRAPRCPDCAARAEAQVHHGIGGWLLLPAFNVLLQPLLGLGGGGLALYVSVKGAQDGALVAGPLLAYGAFATWVAVQFFRKKTSAPALYIAMLLVNVGLALALQASPVRAAIAAAIWVPYFLVSARVKATFVH